MLRNNDIKQLGNLYHHIITERCIQTGTSPINESILDDIADADPDELLDPSTAGERDAEFYKKTAARGITAQQYTKDTSLFDLADEVNERPTANVARINDKSEGKQLTTINGKQLQSQLEITYDSNLANGDAALMIYGPSGIGKSDLIRSMAKKFARHERREFVFWSHLDAEGKKEVFANPKHYYVCSIMNSGQLAPEKLSNIPDVFKSSTYVEERAFEEMGIWMTPGISGMLFLDELNHADPDKMNALFSIILEKRLGSKKLQGNRMLIVAAGNLGGGHHVEQLPAALTNRMTSFWFVMDPEDWFDWAGNNNIDPTIIGFVKSAPALNFRAEHDPRNKVDANVGFPCPRNFEMLSKRLPSLFKGLQNGHWQKEADAHNNAHPSENKNAKDMLFSTLLSVASGILGKEWADYWISYIMTYSKFGKLEKLLSLDSKTLASYYMSTTTKDKTTPGERDVLNILGGICQYLHNQLVQALKDSGAFDTKGRLTDEIAGAPPRPKTVLSLDASPEEKAAYEVERQALAKSFKDPLKERFIAMIHGSRCKHLRTVIEALSNVAIAVKNTARVGDTSLNVAEMLPLVAKRVPAGLTKEQRTFFLAVVTELRKNDPKIKEYYDEVVAYMRDVELQPQAKSKQ